MPTTVELPSHTFPRTARRRRGRTALLITAAALGALALIVGALTVANHALTKHDQDRFTASGIREIVIDQDAGDVVLVASPAAGQVSVETASRWALNKPSSAHTVQNGVLTLTGDCANFAVGSCDLDQRVTVPTGTRVRVAVDAGSIHAENLHLTQLDVRTDSGSINATDMTVPSFRGTTSSGSVEASFTAPPRQVTAKTSSGHVTLTVPNAIYEVDAGTSAGQVRIEVPQHPDASRHLYAHSSSGDVAITRR